VTAPLVFVVDDDVDIRDVVREVLEENGYRTIAAGNGRDALDALRGLPELPDVVLLDIMMPVMDGYEFRALQQTDARIARIPVVVLTAVGDIHEKARELCATAALRKPVPLDELLGAVRRSVRCGV
jgi:CheY-like chemotaxis protein